MLNLALIRLYIVLFAFTSWRYFNFTIVLLFLLLPVYLIRFKIFAFPTTLLEMMILIIILVWFSKLIRDRKLKSEIGKIKKIIKENPSLFLAITIFIVSATISVFTSINKTSALGEWKAFYVEPVLLFFILLLTIKDKKQINNIIFALLLCGLVTSVFAIYQKFTGYMVPWEFWENKDTYRVTAWYGFPNAVGLFLAPLVPLAIYFIKENKNKLFRILSIIFIPSALLAILFAKSTGGLIGVLAGIGVLLLFYKKTRKKIIIFGVVSLFVLFLMPNNAIKQELLMQDRSGQIRLDMWGETMVFLSDNPVTGAGLASYKTLIYPYRIDKWIEVFHHPHNIFLTMWVNLGLFGLIGFTWVLVWFFRVGLMNLKRNNFIPFLVASMTVIITTGLVDSPYIKNDLSVLFWLLPALMVISTSEKEKC